jgi:hypothetical protein
MGATAGGEIRRGRVPQRFDLKAASGVQHPGVQRTRFTVQLTESAGEPVRAGEAIGYSKEHIIRATLVMSIGPS